MKMSSNPKGPADAGVVRTSISASKQRLTTVISAMIRCNITPLLYTNHKSFGRNSIGHELYLECYGAGAICHMSKAAANAAKYIFWRVSQRRHTATRLSDRPRENSWATVCSELVSPCTPSAHNYSYGRKSCLTWRALVLLVQTLLAEH